jgi:polyhydroxyalkanoate synthase
MPERRTRLSRRAAKRTSAEPREGSRRERIATVGDHPSSPILPAARDPAAEPAARRALDAETDTQRLNRLWHAAVAPWTGGLSPVSLALAWADWAWHLGVSPGRQLELAARWGQLAREALATSDGEQAVGAADEDPRFRDPAWTAWPFSALRAGFRASEAFWQEASVVPGMTQRHTRQTQFFARQWLDMLTPANGLFTNPVVLREAVASQGQRLAQGARHWVEDVAAATGVIESPALVAAKQFEVGRDVAVTPGKVVLRNRLIELIRYDARTDRVHPEPLLMVPSWIMKYYILDLSPHNSMVRYLVEQGHTVYMLSWRNPDATDRDLTMDDYLRLGVLEALRAIGRLSGRQRPVHAMGYCLGGTLLAIAAAALARPGGVDAYDDLPPLASLTLLAAQTDFAEPGELGLFIDESQVGYLREVTRSKGYLSGEQMAGSFQFLHSRELVWTRRMREYLLGEREQPNDLMAWNADHTRMPARMHNEYLTALYLRNALATGSYRVEGKVVSLNAVAQPLFVVGTERDHVSPWRSVYKLHHLCDAPITFVLTSGGHNAGIVSEPGHAGRHFRMACRAAHGPWLEPDAWASTAPRSDGSWWPAWHAWLADRSSAPAAARPLAAAEALGDAPGQYVLQRTVN